MVIVYLFINFGPFVVGDESDRYLLSFVSSRTVRCTKSCSSARPIYLIGTKSVVLVNRSLGARACCGVTVVLCDCEPYPLDSHDARESL